MNRTLTAITTAALLTLTLTACGSSSTDKADTEPPEQEQTEQAQHDFNVELTYMEPVEEDGETYPGMVSADYNVDDAFTQGMIRGNCQTGCKQALEQIKNTEGYQDYNTAQCWGYLDGGSLLVCSANIDTADLVDLDLEDLDEFQLWDLMPDAKFVGPYAD